MVSLDVKTMNLGNIMPNTCNIYVPTFWFISDTHFFHNADFIYKPRGFSSMEEMNEIIVENWNKTVKPQDIVFHLGDVFMGADIDKAIDLVNRLNGKIYLIIGNHDSDNKLKYLASFCPNIVEITFGCRLKVSKSKTFFLTHYPTLTGNFDTSKTYSIHGHTHELSRYKKEYPLMYNVCCEAINNTPICLDEIISDLNDRKNNFITQGQEQLI